MNKKIKILVPVLVALCLAYPGFAWLIGVQVEASMVKREKEAMTLYPTSTTLISRQYHRGLYGATEDLTYSFSADALRPLAPLGIGAEGGPLLLRVHNTIHHGPLPRFRTIALATFTTDIDLPPQLSSKIRALLGGEPTFQIYSRLGWFGGVTTKLSSAGYTAPLPGGAELTWRALEARSAVSANLSSTALDVSLEGVQLKSAKAQFELQDLRVNVDWKRVFGELYTGPSKLTIGSVKWQSLPDSVPTSMRGLFFTSSGAVDGDYYKVAMKLGAEALQASSTISVTNATYNVSVDHLHAPTLANLMRDQRAAAMNAGGAAAESAVATMEAMKKNGIELLLHEPVISIDRIGFSMSDGEALFSAKASAPGLKREDVEGAQFQAAVMQHLNVAADLRVDEKLANHLLDTTGKKDAMAPQLAALEQQGYIRRDGVALISHVVFAGGKVEVNGKPYPPGR